MGKLTQILDFIRYVLSAWHKAFSKKPKSGESAQTTAEEMDSEAWKKAQERYVESMRKDNDSRFWEGEE